VIAIALVVGLIAYVWTRPAGTELDWKRIGLFVNTLVVFGFLISWLRESWGKLVFWAALIVLLVVHLGIYSYVLRHIDILPGAYYTVLDMAEWVLLVPLMRRIASWSPRQTD
jgi:hypothetical protein